MSHNGDRRDRYQSPDRRHYSPIDSSEQRREYEWNKYVAQGSPIRSEDMDYPRDTDRRRPSESSRGRYRDRSPIRDRRGSEERRSWRESPRRDTDGRDRYDRRDDRRRSPSGSSREWSRGACPTVVVNRVPLSIEESQIRDEVDRFGAPSLSVRIEHGSGPSDSNERICIIEFEGTRDAISWMTEHQGLLRLGRERLAMSYFDPSFDRGDRDRSRRGSQESDYSGRSDSRGGDEYRRHYSGSPTDTMIVKGLDRDTTEASVRSSFEYITHFPIVDIRLVRDKFGVSRGFCFVQWKSVEDCTQVLDYLSDATPRFHIDGRHVALEFSTPQGGGRKARGQPAAQTSSNASISAAVQAAEAAIQAAHWSQNKKSSAKKPEAAKPSTPAVVTKAPEKAQPPAMKPPAAPTTPVKPAAPALIPGQYPAPIIANFSYDQTSGYYYDATTGLYYDSNSRYFYNSYTAQYLYYDANKKIYVPVSNEVQAKEKDKKEQKEQKKMSAKKIAKDMERWAKAQNKKKEEFKKLMEEPGTGNNQGGSKKESSTADTVFMMLEKQSNEADRQAAVSAVYKEDFFKTPDKPQGRGPGAQSNSGLVSYMNTSDDSDDGDDAGPDDEEKLIDWAKLACLLCRRGFASKEMLIKHKEISDLHKQNLEQRRKSRMGTLTKTKMMAPPVDSGETQIKYRDRAAERRKNFGITEPPMRNRDRRREAPVPFEQPTKHGLDDTNLGNQMLQRMGWKSGSGLGKSQSGITAPIQVKQRSRGAGLGLRGSSYGLDGSEGDYRTAAKKVTMMRYMETE
uniref:RNA-binding protein 5-like n=1 Tax=Phallusia mammillata TaxID=59560 RepID=A0A6F9DPV8_9ASCI|nr:RNA-binding protein 5-like [Phallusia mammillata]